MDRDSRFGVKPEKSDSENTSSSNPFEGFSENMQFESSGEFVSGEKLLNEFEEDEQRCREENLFKEVRTLTSYLLRAISNDKNFHDTRMRP